MLCLSSWLCLSSSTISERKLSNCSRRTESWEERCIHTRCASVLGKKGMEGEREEERKGGRGKERRKERGEGRREAEGRERIVLGKV